MEAPGPFRPSFLEIPLLAAGAQVTFATLVNLLAGTPPAPEGTLAFGIGLGTALLIQRRRHEHDDHRGARSPGDAGSWP